ncbi:Putative permease [Ignavibacterium album JCM 16511]|uniref:Putative permease n=1 Tax=Ignavibacterium album (strain DSM 19864 / JCM 16511 / NBRC 101810 / Mat9-16) TaxID=945713 RepID=I0ANJ3_IGNAJ|nr:permease [Ignavibacterium album]AFH50550.1 Putative permease [Ignavibacterium album JCM 16511]
MDWREQYKSFLWITGFFLFAYFMPIETEKFRNSIIDAFALAKWYAQEHVLLCLVPAFFIAGVIAVFISQASVVKHFGAKAKKWKAYLIASVSGTILAVCSCTVLPLFSSIHKRGAGLGPAIAFLYSGPAINILAIILTARVLGLELGIARVIGAVSFSVIIGLIMAFIYRKEEKERADAQLAMPEVEEPRPLWQTTIHFFILVAILVFVNWGKPADSAEGFWYFMYANKWYITALFGISFAVSLTYIIGVKKLCVLLGVIAVIISVIFFYHNPTIPFVVGVVATALALTYTEGEPNQWLGETWGFTKQIMPLLGAGVIVAGFLLGSAEGNGGIIPKDWIYTLVGGNSLFSNFFASVTGAFMYFATLTEIPILQGLINNGMGKGPALALLLAGPALSLPNMLVIRGVIGTQKTIVYVSLVVIMATISGLIYGAIF